LCTWSSTYAAQKREMSRSYGSGRTKDQNSSPNANRNEHQFTHTHARLVGRSKMSLLILCFFSIYSMQDVRCRLWPSWPCVPRSPALLPTMMCSPRHDARTVHKLKTLGACGHHMCAMGRALKMWCHGTCPASPTTKCKTELLT
jgi:hypothetical protein